MDHEKYGIKVGQVYTAADGADHQVKVIDTASFANFGDVVVEDQQSGKQIRMDAFKLAMVRYTLVN